MGILSINIDDVVARFDSDIPVIDEMIGFENLNNIGVGAGELKIITSDIFF